MSTSASRALCAWMALAGLLGACASPAARDPEAGAALAREAACVREVVELHAFFQDWINAELPADEAAFARCSDALAAEFVLSPPEGGVLDRATLLTVVRGAHGSGPLRIWIEDPVVHVLTDDLYAVCYEEWHERAGARRGRSSRAILRPRPSAPGGVEWVRVEEVWIDLEE